MWNDDRADCGRCQINFIGNQETNMAEKITQTAGRDQLGDFAPMFAHLNDDVLICEVWNVSEEDYGKLK